MLVLQSPATPESVLALLGEHQPALLRKAVFLQWRKGISLEAGGPEGALAVLMFWPLADDLAECCALFSPAAPARMRMLIREAQLRLAEFRETTGMEIQARVSGSAAQSLRLARLTGFRPAPEEAIGHGMIRHLWRDAR